MAAAARRVGNHERHQHTERRRRNAVEQLNRNDHNRVARPSEYRTADAQWHEAQHEERTAAPALSRAPNRGRDGCDNELRSEDADRDHRGRPLGCARRQGTRHDRQHGSIRQLE